MSSSFPPVLDDEDDDMGDDPFLGIHDTEPCDGPSPGSDDPHRITIDEVHVDVAKSIADLKRFTAGLLRDMAAANGGHR
jgi:hypothetical protein